ncbi:TPA: hypothetical protein OCP62_004337 [Escherichia coli]|nr:hypothetical protein [Escherichia coli]
MTTIAFDGKTMASDTRVVCGGNYYNTDTKIYENDFAVIGVAGNAEAGILLVKDDSILVPKHYDFDFSALVWVKDIETLCKVEIYKSWDCALSSVIPVADGFAAVGSGAPYALAAMYLGNTATRAITVAAQFDTNTGARLLPNNY